MLKESAIALSAAVLTRVWSCFLRRCLLPRCLVVGDLTQDVYCLVFGSSGSGGPARTTTTATTSGTTKERWQFRARDVAFLAAADIHRR